MLFLPLTALEIELLGVLEAAEVSSDLGPLSDVVLHHLEALHELDSLVITRLHKGFLGNVKVEFLERFFGQ